MKELSATTTRFPTPPVSVWMRTGRHEGSATLLRMAALAALAGGVCLSTVAQTTANSSSANTTSAQGSQGQPASSMKPHRDLRASKVIGMSVRNPSGRNIGQINDLIVDMNTEEVRYAILSFDPGILSGERLFAVPTTELRMAGDRNDLVYDMDRQRLERAARNRTDWDRAWRDPDYLVEMDKAWGIRQPSDRARSFRVSDLLGKDVHARDGENIGEIEEVVVDMANQRVHYAVLEFDPGWARPDQNYAFPLQSFNLGRDGDELVLDVDKATVHAMKGFTDDRYANLNDRVWIADIDRYLITAVPASGNTSTSGTSASGTGAQRDTNAAGNRATDTRADTDALRDAKNDVLDAVQVVQRMKSDPEMAALLQQARGVFIMPNYGRGALGIGAQGGEGVFVTRQGANFSNPVFFNLAGISVGAQAGGAGGPLAMLLMTDRAVQKFTSGRTFSINADAGLTIVDYSERAQASAGKVQDVVVWSGTRGAYAGASIGLTGITVDDESNRAYYGRNDVTPSQILGGNIRNPQHNVIGHVLNA